MSLMKFWNYCRKKLIFRPEQIWYHTAEVRRLKITRAVNTFIFVKELAVDWHRLMSMCIRRIFTSSCSETQENLESSKWIYAKSINSWQHLDMCLQNWRLALFRTWILLELTWRSTYTIRLFLKALQHHSPRPRISSTTEQLMVWLLQTFRRSSI